MSVDSILQAYPDAIVVRRCNLDHYEYSFSKDGNKYLSEKVLGLNVLELSVNLLGGEFKLCHLPFRPNLNFVSSDWNGTDLPQTPIDPSSYTIEEGFPSVFFYIKDLHNYAFPYEKSITSKEEYKQIKAQFEKEQESLKNTNIEKIFIGEYQGCSNKKTNVCGRLLVNHHPTILNYWHMQIDAYTAIGEDKLIPYDASNGEARAIRRNLRLELSGLLHEGPIEETRSRLSFCADPHDAAAYRDRDVREAVSG